MRMSILLRATVLAAALAAPLAQVALADEQTQQDSQQTQQASMAHNSGSFATPSTGPYSNDAVMSPAIGD